MDDIIKGIPGGGCRRTQQWTIQHNRDGNLARARDLLNSDRRLGVRMIAQTLNLSKSAVHELVADEFDSRNVCAKLVLKRTWVPGEPQRGKAALSTLKSGRGSVRLLYTPEGQDRLKINPFSVD